MNLLGSFAFRQRSDTALTLDCCVDAQPKIGVDAKETAFDAVFSAFDAVFSALKLGQARPKNLASALCRVLRQNTALTQQRAATLNYACWRDAESDQANSTGTFPFVDLVYLSQ